MKTIDRMFAVFPLDIVVVYAWRCLFIAHRGPPTGHTFIEASNDNWRRRGKWE